MIRRVLCALGRHQWEAVRITRRPLPGLHTVTEVCIRPSCRGRITRTRAYR